MENWKVLTLIGGISRNSLNKKFFQSMQNLSIDGLEFSVFDISKLPYFSQDIENDPPDIVTEFKEKIRECDAVLIVTPEYNHSFPGVLKNALDWGSRPFGQVLWDEKPAAIAGATPGRFGTYGAQYHLRQVCSYLNMHVMSQPELLFQAANAFDEKNNFTSESSKKFVIKFLEAFKLHIDIFLQQAGGHYKSQGLEDSPLAH